MKKRTWLSMGALCGALLFLCGCPTVEKANYKVMSYAEIPLNKGASVRVMADREENVWAARALADALAASDAFNVTYNEKADYWFVLAGTEAYRDKITVPVTVKKVEETLTVGQDVLVETKHNVASAARELAIAVYDAKNLAPIHYMTVAIHDGDNSEETTRDQAAYATQFADEVMERVKDAFLTQEKDVEISIPLEANADLRDAFKEGNYERFNEIYKGMDEINIADYVESIRNETCEDDNIDETLANYHLHLLVTEATDKNVATLKKLQKEHLMLLQVSQAEGLIEAVPVALARIEYQLNNIE